MSPVRSRPPGAPRSRRVISGAKAPGRGMDHRDEKANSRKESD